MITIPLIEACVAVGGRPDKSISPLDYVSKVTQYSKDVEPGTLFVALRGNRVDGHSFIQEAEKLGAVAAVVEYRVSNAGIPQIVVPSTVEALGDLGRIWRGRLNIPVIAVTGSVGKTSTKELIAHTLDSKFNTHKSRKNYNNQLGVPIELMRLDREHECSVVEFGMRDLNQINYLSRIARPSVAVITNVGVSHINVLKTRENIARAKAEIFEGVDSEGIAILNRDDDFFDFVKGYSNCRVITFGENEEADIRISDIRLSKEANPLFRLNGREVTMSSCVGKYHAYNAAIAYAVATEMGVDKDSIFERFSTFVTPERRGVFSYAKNGALLLDSTYSAAPDSIKASLYTLAELKKRGKRTVAVIGEMLELGSHSEEAHRHIGKFVSGLGGVDLLVTVGKYAEFTGREAGIKEWRHFENSEPAAEYLLKEVKGEEIVLLQGSNNVSLDLVVNALEKGTI